ncbi:MAG: hypothetical protein Q8P12_01645, partial [bacterium]|nr:hypothetical protein [bacterium]
MRKPLSGHTLVGFLIHTAVMVMVAFWGGGILTKAVNETILKISAPTEIKKEARLLLSPPTGLITKGNRISLQIIVYPGAVDINAVGATVRYPANLKVVNLSRAGSFCTLYPEEFVNHQSRTVRIGCGLPTPGLTASSGVVGTINFEAVRTGRALVELDLAASSVHANDGQGTDVLARVEGAVLDIAEPAPQVAEAAAPAPPKITVISSPTHPDQDRWYSENLAVFQWIKETGVTGYAGLLDQSPQSTPDPTVMERSNIREFSG